MTRSKVTIVDVEKDQKQQFFGNSRRLIISVKLPNGLLGPSVVMTHTAQSPKSEKKFFDWFWENAKPDTSCILVQDEVRCESFLEPPSQ